MLATLAIFSPSWAILVAADEPEALEVLRRVDPVPRGGPGCLGREPEGLVVADGLRIDATFPR